MYSEISKKLFNHIVKGIDKNHHIEVKDNYTKTYYYNSDLECMVMELSQLSATQFYIEDINA